MKRIITGLILAVSLLLTVSCANSAQPSDNQSAPAPTVSSTVNGTIIGSHWRAVSVNGTAVITGSNISLDFRDDGTFSGNSGVNYYGGNYTLNAPDIQFSHLVITLLLGPDKRINQQENIYISCLDNAASYSIKDSRLEIFDSAGRQLLTFERTP